MHVCIITDSPDLSSEVVATLGAFADLVIVADGAVHRMPKGITPHVICGDFDSIDRSLAEKRYPTSEFIHSQCQESNDLEKCVALALERGARQLSIVGTMGGRLDQALTIFSVIEQYHKRVPIVFHDGKMSCRILSSDGAEPTSYSCSTSAGDCISLVPRGDGVTISITGVRWPLNAERLTPGSRGVSNKALESSVALTVHSGVVFFIHGPS